MERMRQTIYALLDFVKNSTARQMVLYFGGFSVLIFLLGRCSVPHEPPNHSLQQSVRDAMSPAYIDLDSIKKRGKLVALSRYSTTSFFIYRGQPMGYEHDLLKLFAEEIGVELEIKTPSTWDSLYTMLERGEGDIIAANLPITINASKRVAFSKYHSSEKQVLIQRMPDNWRKLKRHQIERKLVRDPLKLIGKSVTVRRGSSYEERLRNLIEEIGGGIRIDLVKSDMENEQLIRLVSDGLIDYTIAHENVASLNSAYYNNIDVKTAVSFPQRIAWAFRKSSPDLKVAVDEWMKKLRAKNDPTYYVIYNRYFKNKRDFKERMKSEHFLLETGMISEYDSLFQAHATDRFPWTLLAAQAYQESRFDPTLSSRFGAIGLMQLLPETADLMGIEKPEKPAQGVKAAVAYLNYLYAKHWSYLPDEEALKFTLASYNAGPGHVLDAQRLAKKFGQNPDKWYDVSQAILKLSHKKYIYMPEVRYGFCRGEEPRNYVKEILKREKMYSTTIAEAERRRLKKAEQDSLNIVEEQIFVEQEEIDSSL